MYLCLSICLHPSIYPSIRVCICRYVCTYMCTCVIYVCVHVDTYVCVYIHAYKCMYVCINMYVYICIYIYGFLFLLVLWKGKVKNQPFHEISFMKLLFCFLLVSPKRAEDLCATWVYSVTVSPPHLRGAETFRTSPLTCEIF